MERLHDEKEHAIIRVKILHGLAEQNSRESIPEILKYLDSKNEDIKLAAIECLSKFKNLRKQILTEAITRYQIINKLKEIFQKNNSEEIRMHVVKALSHFDKNEIVPFLIQTLEKSPNSNIQSDCIYLCRQFHDYGINLYIKPFLNSKNLNVKAEAIATLYNLEDHKQKLNRTIKFFLKNNSQQIRSWGYYILGEIGDNKAIPTMIKELATTDKACKRRIALALIKLNQSAGEAAIIELLMDNNENESKYTEQTIRLLDEKVQKKLYNLLNQTISVKISDIIASEAATKVANRPITITTLRKLHKYYRRAHEHKEMLSIEKMLTGKKFTLETN